MSPRTVRRRLLERNLPASLASKNPNLGAKDVKIRPELDKKNMNWTLSDWERILWTDESFFEIFGYKRREVFRGRDGERFLPDYVQETVKNGGDKLQVLGSFSAHGVGPLVSISGNMDQKFYKSIL